MSDFYFQTSVLRQEMADALMSNTEQTMWVLSEIALNMYPDELAQFSDNLAGNRIQVAQFFHDLSEAIKRDGE